MTDAEKLIERLEAFFIFDDGANIRPPILKEAAAMLRSLADEIERLRAVSLQTDSEDVLQSE